MSDKRIKFSHAFKLDLVEKIESRELSIAEAKQQYNIKGNDTIQRWLEKYGKERRVTKVDNSYIKELQAENAQLKDTLSWTQVEKHLLDTLVEVSSKELNIDLKKNFGYKRLKVLKKKD